MYCEASTALWSITKRIVFLVGLNETLFISTGGIFIYLEMIFPQG